jgi:hypothetical protein
MLSGFLICVIFLVASFIFKHTTPCIYCGTKLADNEGLFFTPYAGAKQQRICYNCFQKEILDKQGNCPYCGKPMSAYETIGIHISNDKWYHKACADKMEHERSHSPIIEKETIKEIVKIRCPFCANLYDEKIDKCPHCGGNR